MQAWSCLARWNSTLLSRDCLSSVSLSFRDWISLARSASMAYSISSSFLILPISLLVANFSRSTYSTSD
jgi:hypothetical protein